MIFAVLQAILAFILVLAPLVFIHELGHFLAAKMFGIGVPVFSLGFGPRLFGFRRAETDYRVSLIPMGGYVRMTGDESDENRSGAPEEFLSKPKWQRFVVFVAGALFNIILAFVAMWLLFGVYGKEEVPEIYPTVMGVVEGSAVEQAGVRRGDKLIAIEGQDVKDPRKLRDVYNMEILLAPNTEKTVRLQREGRQLDVTINTGADPRFGWGSPDWYLSQGSAVVDQVVPGERADQAGIRSGDRIVGAGDRETISEVELRMLLQASAEKEIELKIERGDEVIRLTVVPARIDGKGRIGVDFRLAESVHRELSLLEAARESLQINLANSKMLFVVLKRLATQQVPLKSMSGPIGIAQVARRALIDGPQTFLLLLGFFSLQLGILNLLPIPVLDGGHILLLGVESVMRRDLSEKLKERAMLAGLVFLVVLMVAIVYLDVLKLKTW